MIVKASFHSSPGTAPAVSLITGGTGDVGRAIALGLSAKGHRVAIQFQKRQGAAEQIVEEIRGTGGTAVAVACDLSQIADVRILVDKVEAELGPLSCLVHGATPPIAPKAALDCDGDELLQHLTVQAMSLARLCQAVVPAMQRQQNGVILGFLSTVLELPRPKLWWPYTLAKFAALGVLSGLATDVEGTGVRVVSLMPSGIASALSQGAGLEQAPLLDRSDVANLVLRIVAEKARFPNGAVVRLDPGASEVGRFHFQGERLQD